MRHLTIADGRASVPGGTALGGGLLNDGASVSVDHVTFEDNRAVGHRAVGGAVANLGGTFIADHTDFVGNGVQCDDGQECFGGAVFNDQGAAVEIDHAMFSNNTSVAGGANGGAIDVADGSVVNLDHCAFDCNEALGAPSNYAAGGAIHAIPTGLNSTSNPTLNVSHCSFSNNRSRIRSTVPAGPDALGQGLGGAIMIEFGPTAVVEHSSFDGNAAQGCSGGNGAAGPTAGSSCLIVQAWARRPCARVWWCAVTVRRHRPSCGSPSSRCRREASRDRSWTTATRTTSCWES